ncbi:MAG: beta-lactamase family protein [Microcella sp.]|uniref:serine hydrolase domain-containing protein n=1 Tax=Microcella sp. TaxID=1913979 RepID=UPI0024CC57DD|nr:serine hydrolase domain-containing protein [Microcella sp.]UYN83143.1 MAG: beta-lactamase family protein [Microcella sp.]
MTPSFSAAAEWTRRHVDAGRLPVAVLGIADTKGVLHLEAFGTDQGRTAAVDDRFALYSVTKPLVALTAMRAVERGLLTVDTPLRDALPEFAHPQVALRHLVSHTSGIVDLVLGAPAHGGATTLRDAVERAPLEFITGTARRYNNLAWAGVTALIEHATGRDFEAEFAELTAAVGAAGLSFDTDDVHALHGGARYAHDPADLLRLRHPAAGAAARATDLLAIGTSLLTDDGAVVSSATLTAMQRPLTDGLYIIDADPAKRFENFGLGFNLPRRPGLIDHSVFGHAGWSGTQFWVSPKTGVCVVLLTNRLDATEPDVGVRFDELQNTVFARA